MSGTDMNATQAGGNNASEFVRKLFRMLEDPSHQDVARWGKDGDTFVVVEGEKFTRSILPKHFKHSNMSSFIRQLNKYDFHKVKPSSDSETSSPNGNVLEFKHPYFRIDSKDDLDNIRRKAPAPRKPQATEDYTANQHISVISEQLTATQQQVQQLQELFAEVSQTNRVLVNEVLTLQKMLNAQKQAQHEMLNYLTPYDGQNNSLIEQTTMGTNNNVSASDAHDSVPELRRARELLSSVSANPFADRELERLHGVYGSPADSGPMITPTTVPMMHDPIADIARYPVYPVGQTVGIDPFHSDHIHKIPFAIPNDSSASGITEQAPPQPPTISQQQGTNVSAEKPGMIWGPKRPLVFLVEDDSICSKIGIKFLKSMGCEVEHASDGAEAYSRMTDSSQEQPDMIFMDIIMPRLDGVSATLYIRQHCPSTPIIAMTSNIRPEEVNGYFEHGMNGVLAKPFTREGMLKSVRTHLSHLLKNPPASENSPDASGYFLAGPQYMSAPGQMGNSGASIKFETTTTPPAGSTWSPGIAQASPLGQSLDQNYGLMNGNSHYNLSAGGSRANFQTKLSSPGGRMIEQDSPPEKRQRLNPTQGTY